MRLVCQDNIKFYILVPVYNTEKYIRECILSVLDQTYENFELILVDDGSPDQAGTICDEYAAKDFRVHVIHKENEGQLSARSAAISYVKGNCAQNHAFYVFVDSDDYLQSNALEVLADVIEKKQSDVVVYGIQRVVDGKRVSVLDKAPYAGSVTDKRNLYKIVFSDVNFNSLCRKAISCSLFSDIDWHYYYHISHGEDLLQSIPIYKNCRNVEFIDSVLYNYRVNPVSVTQSISHQNYTGGSAARAAVWRFLQEEACFTETDWEEYLRYCCSLLRRKTLRICEFQTGKECIFTLLDEVRADDYHSMLLSSKHNDRVLMWLKKRNYTRLYHYATMRKRLIEIYRKMKHI